MPLPQRTKSQTVRVPRFLRTSTVQRPARFGPGAQVLPAETVPPESGVHGEVDGGVSAQPTDSPTITMPASPTVEPSDAALPSILVDDAEVPPDLIEPADDGAEALGNNPAAEVEEGNVGAPHDEMQPPPAMREETLNDLEAALDRIGKSARHDALALGLALARRLVGLYIDADEDALTTLVDSAMQRLQPATALEVALHPDDISMLDGHNAVAPGDDPEANTSAEMNAETNTEANTETNAEMNVDTNTDTNAAPPTPSSRDAERKLSTLAAGAAVRIVPDPSLARGEARVKSEVGEVDATLDARFKVAQAVLEELE